MRKVALGYGYDKSGRTRLYASLVYIDSSNAGGRELYNDTGRASESMSRIQMGIVHKF